MSWNVNWKLPQKRGFNGYPGPGVIEYADSEYDIVNNMKFQNYSRNVVPTVILR